MTDTYKLVTSAVLIAFGVLLPMVFHLFGVMGIVFLPMHIPVLIAGLFLGSKAGFLTGLLTPILSSFTTGMPPIMPMLPAMAAELSVYGLAGGYLHHRKRLPLILSLISAMVLGRIAGVAMVHVMVLAFGIRLQPVTYLKGAVLTGFPGIIIQLILIPLIVNRLHAVFHKNK